VNRLIPALTAEQKAALEAAVREMLERPGKPATKFKHTGRSAERGVDCVGLLVVGLRAAGFDVRGRRDYTRIPNPLNELRETLVAHLGPAMHRNHAQAGDVLLMQWHQHPCHVGLLTNNNGVMTLIHALAEETQRVIEQRYAHPWPPRVVGVFRP